MQNILQDQQVNNMDKFMINNDSQLAHKLSICRLPVQQLDHILSQTKVAQAHILKSSPFLNTNPKYQTLSTQLKKYNEDLVCGKCYSKYQQQVYQFLAQRLSTISFISPTLQEQAVNHLYHWYYSIKKNKKKMELVHQVLLEKQHSNKIQTEIQDVRSTFKSTAPSRLYQYDRHRLALPSNECKTETNFHSKKMSSCSARPKLSQRLLLSQDRKRFLKSPLKLQFTEQIIDQQTNKSQKSEIDQELAILILNKRWLQNENRMLAESKQNIQKKQFVSRWAINKERTQQQTLAQKQALMESQYRRQNYNCQSKYKPRRDFYPLYLQKLRVKSPIQKVVNPHIKIIRCNNQNQNKSINQLMKESIKKNKIRKLLNSQIIETQKVVQRIEQEDEDKFRIISKLRQMNLASNIHETQEVLNLKKSFAKNRVVCSHQTLRRAVVNPLTVSQNIDLPRPGSMLIWNPLQKEKKKLKKSKNKKK